MDQVDDREPGKQVLGRLEGRLPEAVVHREGAKVAAELEQPALQQRKVLGLVQRDLDKVGKVLHREGLALLSLIHI